MKFFIKLLIGVFLAGAGYGVYRVNNTVKIFNKYSLNKKPLTKTSRQKLHKKIENKQSVNFLLLGVDDGALKRHEKGRSDTIMILSLNPKTKKSELVSIPRDMGAVMPGQANVGEAKVNTAYLLGGPHAMAKCVKQHFDVPIDGYAVINMGGLEALLKAVGGVRVKSDLTFTQDWYHFKKGHYYKLHGKKALAYIRERHEDPRGDYGRQVRQRQVLKAIVKKLTHSTVLLDQAKAKKIAKHVHTDLTKQDFIKLGLNYRDCLSNMHDTHAQGYSKDVYNMNYGLMEIEEMTPKENKRITKIIKRNMQQ